MSQKSILITGCSSGIGLATARALKVRGWRVFAACRQVADCERLIGAGFESPRIDYCDTDSIEAGLAEVLAATGGTLDALFYNGAHQMPACVEDLPTDALRATFEANFFGWHELTRRVVPVMRAQGHGRILNCGSILGFSTMRWRSAYAATKYALEALTETLRLELRDTDIHVSLIEPGPITTDLRKKSLPYFEKWIDWEGSAQQQRYEEGLLKRLYDTRGNKDPFEEPASAVADQVIRALEAKDPHLRYFVTRLTWIVRCLRRVLPDRAVEALTDRY